jgi:hypothetical protein
MARTFKVGDTVSVDWNDVQGMFERSRSGYPSLSFVQQIAEYEGAIGDVEAVFADTGFIAVRFRNNPKTGYRGWLFQLHTDWLGN